jgi:hypothetical protein
MYISIYICLRSDDIKGYFQDDLYRNVAKQSPYNASDWTDNNLNTPPCNPPTPPPIYGDNNEVNNNKNSNSTLISEDLPPKPAPLYSFPPVYESLKPDNMMNLSEIPENPLKSQLKSKISLFKNEIHEKDVENKVCIYTYDLYHLHIYA